jgi:hypothetical protein
MITSFLCTHIASAHLTCANPSSNLSTDKRFPRTDSCGYRGTSMSETGQSWRLGFNAHPSEANRVRRWVRSRVEHPDAPLVAHELFIFMIPTGTHTIEMTLSTADSRTRITAASLVEMSLRNHGYGPRIIDGLSTRSGVTLDGRGLWALLTTKDVT